MGEGRPIAIGAVAGLLLGILVGVLTEVPFAPEGGVVLGGLAGWVEIRRRRD